MQTPGVLLNAPQSMLGFEPGLMPTQGVDAEGVSVKLTCTAHDTMQDAGVRREGGLRKGYARAITSQVPAPTCCHSIDAGTGNVCDARGASLT
jgi:hypothetical protein